MKTLEELRKLDLQKLVDESNFIKKDLFKIEFEVKNGQSKGNHEIKQHRRQVAKIETVITEKKAAETKAV